MAATDQQMIDDLISDVNTGEEALQELLSSMHSGVIEDSVDDQTYYVTVECESRDHQTQVQQWLTGKGYQCKAKK